MCQIRCGPWKGLGFDWSTLDSKTAEGDMAHIHRSCLSDKRNLACSSTSRSREFGSSDCSISPLAYPFLCLDYLSFVFNRSIVYSPIDYFSPAVTTPV